MTRILAIGDIHGCLTALDRLLAEVRPRPEDLLVTLGDYVDRGPDSKGVIERLLELATSCTLMPLRGNHEVMMLRACQAWRDAEEWRSAAGRLPGALLLPTPGLSAEEREWLACGGKPTLASYGELGRPGTLADVPAEHLRFLEETCQDWYESERHFFVHANAYPDLPLAEQPSHMLHWEQVHQPVRHCSGKIMVCGHTPQVSGKPRCWDTTIVLDTWVYGDGWLSCLDITSGKVWQANQRGEFRALHVD